MKPALSAFLGLILWLVMAFATAGRPLLINFWQGVSVILFSLAVFDAWRVWRMPIVSVQRQVASSLPVGVWSEVILQLYNSANQAYRVEVFDDYPSHE